MLKDLIEVFNARIKEEMLSEIVARDEEVVANGAGDVFGATFLLRYYETKDVHKAAIFASCAASFVVEKEGVEGVPCMEGVNERMSMYHNKL